MQINNLIRTQAYINGQWVNGRKGKTFDVNNPATGELIATIADMDRDDVRLAIDAAHNA